MGKTRCRGKAAGLTLSIEGQESNQLDPLAERKRLTFEQAEGAEPIPTQLRLKELSPALRAALWAMVLDNLNESTRQVDYVGYIVVDPWRRILEARHVYQLHKMADEFNNHLNTIRPELKALFQTGDYVRVFGFLQFVLRHQDCPYRFADKLEVVLKYGKAAYRVADRTIVPLGSDAEFATINQAFADVAKSEFHGARAHLRKAAEELTSGRHADSIRESIHAVESVAKVLEPQADLSKALTKLEKSAAIHGAMKAGFLAIYGYTSNEQGIRHALLEAGAPAVDETDALFMIGACAAFVSYMINKVRTAGLISNSNRQK
jgi:hypothetical protein